MKKRAKTLLGHGATSFVHCPSCFAAVAAPFLPWHLSQCPSSNHNTRNENPAHSLPSGLAPPTPVKKELAEELPRSGANGNRGLHSSYAHGSSIPYVLSPAVPASHEDSPSPVQEVFPQNSSQEAVGLGEQTNMPCSENFDPGSSDSLASCLKSQEEHFRRREHHLKSAMSILRRKYEEGLRREQELENNYTVLLTKEQDLQRQLLLSKQAEEKALKLVESLRGELQEKRGLGGSDCKQIEVIDLEDACGYSDRGATGLGTANSAIVRLEDGHEDAVLNRAFRCSLKSHDSPSSHKNVACRQNEQPSPVLASLVQGGPKEGFSPALKADGNFQDVFDNVGAIGTCIVKTNKVIGATEVEHSMQGLNTSSSPHIKNTCAFCRVSVLGSTTETVGEGCPSRHNSKFCDDLSKSASCLCTPYRLGADQQTTSNNPSDIGKVLVRPEILDNQSLEPGPQTPGKLGRHITLSNPSDDDSVLEKSGKLDNWCPEHGSHTPQMSSQINKVLEKSRKLYDRSPEHSPEKLITCSEVKEHQNMVSKLLFPGDQSRQSLWVTEADVRARDQSIECHLGREESGEALGSRAFAAVKSEAAPIPNAADMSEHKLVSDQYQTAVVTACNPGIGPASLAESRQERDPKTRCPERGAGLSTEEQIYPQACSGNQLLGSRSLSSNSEETHLLTRKAKSRRHRPLVLSDSESESSCRRNLKSSLQGAKSWQIGSCQMSRSDLNVLKNQSETQSLESMHQNILKISERGGFATNIVTTGLSDTHIEVPSGGQSEHYSHDTKIMEKAHNKRRKKLVKGYRQFQNEKMSKKDQVNESIYVPSAVKDGQIKHFSAEAGTKQPDALIEDATIEGSEEGVKRAGVSVRRSERLKKSSSRKAEDCIRNESVSNGNGSDKNMGESLGGLLVQGSTGTKQPETLMEEATIEGFEEGIERAGVSVGVRRSERLKKSSSRKAKNSIQNESVSNGNGSDKNEGESLGGFLVQEEQSSDCKSMSFSGTRKLAKESICSDDENAQPKHCNRSGLLDAHAERMRSSRMRKRLFDELSETENNDNSKPGHKIQTDNRLGDQQDLEDIINLLNESDKDGDGYEEDEMSEGESLGGFIVNNEDSEGREDSQTSKEGDLSGSSGRQGSSDESRESFSQDSSSSSGSSFHGFRRRVDQKRKSYTWDFEADMLVVLATDSELCLRAVCALYRQQTEEEQRGRGSFSTNKRGFDKIHASKGSLLAEFLTDEVPSGPLKKTLVDLEKYDSNGVEYCRKLAIHHSKQLFEIYKNREDPHFPFR